MQLIPMHKPLTEEDEIRAAKEALEIGWLGMVGFVAKFEEAIYRYVDASDK